MADTIQTAIYRLGLSDQDYQQSAARVAAANAKLVDGFSKIEAQTDKTEAAARRLARGILQLERAREAGLGDEARQAAQLARLTAAYDEQVRSATRAGVAGRNFGSAIQNVGFQVGDLATQIASGGGVLRPLIQQGTQLVSAFGPVGAVLGAVGAVAGAVAVSFMDLGDEAADATPKLETWAEKIERAAEAMEEASKRGERSAAAFAAHNRAMIGMLKSQLAAIDAAQMADVQARLQQLRGAEIMGQTMGVGQGSPVTPDVVTGLNRRLDPSAGADRAKVLIDMADLGAFEDGRKYFGQSVGTPFDWASYYRDQAQEAEKAAKKEAEARKEIARANEDYSKSLLELQDRLDPVAGAQRAMEKDLVTLDLAYERGRLGIDEYNRQVQELYGSYEDKLDPAAKALRKLTEAHDQQRASLEGEIRAAGMSDEARAVYIAGIEAENKLIAEGVDLSEARARAYIEEARALARMKVEHDQQAEDLKKMAQFFESFLDQSIDRIGGGITEALATGQIEFAKFGDIGRAVLSQLIQLAIQLAVINPIKNWATGGNDPTMSSIFEVLSAGLSGFLGGGYSGPGLQGSGTGSVGPFAGFASGGSFRVGGSGGTDSQLVAFRASPDETVTVTRPDQAIGGAPISIVQNIQIDGGAGTPQQNQDFAERNARELKRAVRDAVRDQLRQARRPMAVLDYD